MPQQQQPSRQRNQTPESLGRSVAVCDEDVDQSEREDDREGVGAVCVSALSARAAVATTVDMAGSFITKDFFT